jgi:CBS domain-containing protein
MKLRDVMTSDVTCASPSESLTKIAADMKRHNIGIMPICENDKLMGVLTDRDIVIGCVASGSNPGDCIARNFMTTGLTYGTPDMDVQQACELMGSAQVHRLPVVQNGRLTGMVSLGDLAIHLKDSNLVTRLLRDISTPIRSATENIKGARKAA